MTTRTASTKTAPVTPEINDDTLDEWLKELGDNLRAQGALIGPANLQLGPLNAILNSVKEQIRMIETARDEALAPLQVTERALFVRIYDYSNTHWDRLAGATKSRVTRAAGVIMRRNNPPKILISDPKEVLARLEQLKLDIFIRHPEPTINLEAMGENPDKATAVEGVTRFQDVKYSVQPTGEKAISDVQSKLKLEAGALKPKASEAAS